MVVQFCAGQDRQQLWCPPRHEIVAPRLAGAAQAHVAGHDQPQGSGQHQPVTANALRRNGVTHTVSHNLPQFLAPGGRACQRIPGGLRGHERVDLEGAQHRLSVLNAQPANPGNVGAQLSRRAAAVQAACYQQLVQPLPRFGQRGHDPR